MRITVIGAGNAGFAFAAHLSMKGHQVYLYEAPDFADNLQGLSDLGKINISGAVEGICKIEKLATDISEALAFSDLLIVPVPGFGQDVMMKLMLPHLRSEHIIVFFPGNYAALRMLRFLKESGSKADPVLAESPSMLYACRRIGPAEVNIRAVKNKLSISALPAIKTPQVLERMNELFGAFVPAHNVLEVSMNNPNCVVHSPTCILNAGWIQNGGDFDFYWEGMTPAVCNVLSGIDSARTEIGRRLGIALTSLEQSFVEFYGLKADSLHELLTTSPIHGKTHAPKSLLDRYVSEDVPYGLVPLSQLGRLVGVDTSLIDAIISIASRMNGVDYIGTGITLDRLGLKDLSIKQILSLVA